MEIPEYKTHSMALTEIANKLNMNRDLVESIIRSFFTSQVGMIHFMRTGDKINIKGLGIFKRNGKNWHLHRRKKEADRIAMKLKRRNYVKGKSS